MNSRFSKDIPSLMIFTLPCPTSKLFCTIVILHYYVHRPPLVPLCLVYSFVVSNFYVYCIMPISPHGSYISTHFIACCTFNFAADIFRKRISQVRDMCFEGTTIFILMYNVINTCLWCIMHLRIMGLAQHLRTQLHHPLVKSTYSSGKRRVL